MRVRIRGKVWDLSFSSEGLGDDDDGFCDSPSRRGKRILIRPGLRPERELDVTVHEITHAALWDLDEEAVEEFATDLARALYRLGYRKITDPPPCKEQ